MAYNRALNWTAAILIGLFAAGAENSNLHAQVSPEVRADLLQVQIAQDIERGQYNAARSKIAEYKKLGIRVPPTIYSLEAKMLVLSAEKKKSELDAVRELRLAKKALEGFFNSGGKEHPKYRENLEFYAGLDQKIGAYRSQMYKVGKAFNDKRTADNQEFQRLSTEIKMPDARYRLFDRLRSVDGSTVLLFRIYQDAFRSATKAREKPIIAVQLTPQGTEYGRVEMTQRSLGGVFLAGGAGPIRTWSRYSDGIITIRNASGSQLASHNLSELRGSPVVDIIQRGSNYFILWRSDRSPATAQVKPDSFVLSRLSSTDGSLRHIWVRDATNIGYDAGYLGSSGEKISFEGSAKILPMGLDRFFVSTQSMQNGQWVRTGFFSVFDKDGNELSSQSVTHTRNAAMWYGANYSQVVWDQEVIRGKPLNPDTVRFKVYDGDLRPTNKFEYSDHVNYLNTGPLVYNRQIVGYVDRTNPILIEAVSKVLYGAYGGRDGKKERQELEALNVYGASRYHGLVLSRLINGERVSLKEITYARRAVGLEGSRLSKFENLGIHDGHLVLVSEWTKEFTRCCSDDDAETRMQTYVTRIPVSGA